MSRAGGGKTGCDTLKSANPSISAVEEWNQWWLQKAQPPLARLSTRGRLVIVDNRVGLESIVEAVRDVVTEIRTEH